MGAFGTIVILFIGYVLWSYDKGKELVRKRHSERNWLSYIEGAERVIAERDRLMKPYKEVFKKPVEIRGQAREVFDYYRYKYKQEAEQSGQTTFTIPCPHVKENVEDIWEYIATADVGADAYSFYRAMIKTLEKGYNFRFVDLPPYVDSRIPIVKEFTAEERPDHYCIYGMFATTKIWTSKPILREQIARERESYEAGRRVKLFTIGGIGLAIIMLEIYILVMLNR